MRTQITTFLICLCLVNAAAALSQQQRVQAGTVNVPILIYHSIRPYRPADLAGVRKYIATPETLAQEFSYLRDNGYVSVSFDDLVRRLRDNVPLPPKPVVICFDDGPETQYEYALPLLRKYSLTATFFLFTNAIGRPHYLTWSQVSKLDAHGMQIGCHSRCHPYLTRIENEATLWDEIYGAKMTLEAHLGKAVTVFAYPFGQYNDHIVELVKKAGYTCARGTFPGVIHSSEDLFTLTGLIKTASIKTFIAGLEEHLQEKQPSKT